MSDHETLNGPRHPKTYVMGLDLGQANDWSALCVNERRVTPDGQIAHDALHLERWQGERYPEIVRVVRDRVNALRGPRPVDTYASQFYPSIRPSVSLVIDHTGCGRPVFDMFLEADLDCQLIGVTITGGQQTTKSDDGFNVPKRILASTLQVVLQTGRFKIAESLRLQPVLTGEMKNFKVKINLLGNESYGAGSEWREDAHDDLVLAAALACWHGENLPGGFEFPSEELVAIFESMGL